MNLLVLAGWFPSPLFPDHGDFVLHQSSLCVREGLPVRVLTADLDWRYFKSPEHYQLKLKREAVDGVTVTRIQGLYWPKWNAWSLYQWVGQWEKAFLKDLESYGTPDLMHAHTWWAGVVAQRLKARYGIPYVLTEHSTELYEMRLPTWKREAMVRAYGGANMNLAVGADLERAMLNMVPNARMELFPNFLDDRLFHAQESPDDGVCHFGFSGSLISRKRPELLAAAFIQVAETVGPERTMLHVAGDGPQRALLARMMAHSGLTQRVRFYGAMDHRKMPGFYRGLSALVLPSLRENFSLAVAEALACGVPVISSRHNAWDGFIHAGNGLLMQEDDLEGLVKCMVLMVKQWRGYDRRAISDEAVRTHGASSRVPQLARLYQDVLRFK